MQIYYVLLISQQKKRSEKTKIGNTERINKLNMLNEANNNPIYSYIYKNERKAIFVPFIHFIYLSNSIIIAKERKREINKIDNIKILA